MSKRERMNRLYKLLGNIYSKKELRKISCMNKEQTK
jgi:hypothetical protein